MDDLTMCYTRMHPGVVLALLTKALANLGVENGHYAYQLFRIASSLVWIKGTLCQ
jgi:hypothetical protein